MTIRRHHLGALPTPIKDNPIAEERIKILRVLAERLPELASRGQIRVVGKGGTLLRLCEGLTRPSTDYDTNIRWTDAAQARTIAQALREIPNVSQLDIIEPTSRTQPVRFSWMAKLHTGETKKIHSFINTKIVPELDEPDYRAAHLRTHQRIATYTSEHLYQGKTNAFCDRGAVRDIYDVWHGLSHNLDRIAPTTRLQLNKHLNHNLTVAQVDEWKENLPDDEVLSGHLDIDDALEGIMECLEKDPIVALDTHPGRELGFLVDTDRRTLSFGLKETDDAPFLALYIRPYANASDVAEFVVASRAPIWDTFDIDRPEGGANAERAALEGIMGETIAHHNAIAAGKNHGH